MKSIAPVIDRRKFLGAAAALPLAAILKNPALAQAAAATLETVTLATAGGRQVMASLARPQTDPAPAVILIHEWWGLNDQIKAMAADMAAQGYLALAVDLYEGQVAASPEEAKSIMSAMDPAEAIDTLVSWVDYLRASPGASGKVGVVGWCFGGGWSLNTALAAPVDACVVYYGNVKKTAAELASLSAPLLGHFATQDQRINREMVDGFTAAMTEAGKPHEVYWYEADHAFANPTGARYDQEDAALAWERTQAFLRTYLGG